MKCYEIMECLEEVSPKSFAESWDNVGLLCGREEKEVSSIYIALDATKEVIGEAKAVGADMLLTHHPMIFKPLKRVSGSHFIGEKILTLAECAAYVKNRCHIEQVKVFGMPAETIVMAAVCPGSGKSCIEDAVRLGADVLITGDIDHHEGIDSVEQGLAIIDAGHYGLEKIFVSYMEEYCRRKLTGVKVYTAPEKDPFWTA